MKYRNWIEVALRTRLVWSPICIGWRGGRRCYSITFEDGTEGDYFIDFERHEIEPCW